MQKAYKRSLLGGAVFSGLLLVGSGAFAQGMPDAATPVPDMGVAPEGPGAGESPRSELKKKRNERASPQPSPGGTPTPQAP